MNSKVYNQDQLLLRIQAQSKEDREKVRTMDLFQRFELQQEQKRQIFMSLKTEDRDLEKFLAQERLDRELLQQQIEGTYIAKIPTPMVIKPPSKSDN